MINMVVLLLIAFFCSFTVTAAMRRYAIANNIYDVQNSRSSHTLKTRRGGGVSIVIVFLDTDIPFGGQLAFQMGPQFQVFF
jgi:Fuc2NAc and GlcNAc transferase